MDFQKITDQKLDDLAKDPKNLVYKYKDRDPLPPDQIPALEDVKDRIHQLWGEVMVVRGEKLHCEEGPMSSLQERKLKWWLFTKSPNKAQWTRFSETHPLIFDRCVGRETTEKEILALMYMIFLKKKQQDGALTDGPEQLQEYLWKTFSMEESEYRARHGDEAKVIDAASLQNQNQQHTNSPS